MRKPQFQLEGYAVVERAEDWEQILSLVTRSGLPALGVLEWSDERDLRTIFKSRAEARQAIKRTDHYAKAFGLEGDLPQGKYCVIVPVRSVVFVEEEKGKA